MQNLKHFKNRITIKIARALELSLFCLNYQYKYPKFAIDKYN